MSYPYVQYQDGLSLCTILEVEFDPDVFRSLKNYASDSLFRPIIQYPERYPLY